MEPISRKEAIRLGLAHYYTAKPCKHGHLTKRQVTNRGCVECHTAIQQRFFDRNPGYEARRVQDYEARVGKEVRGQQKREARQRLLDKDPEYERRKAIAWNKANPEKALEHVRRYRKRRQLECPEKIKEEITRWKAANPERVRQLSRAGEARRRARERGNGGSYSADDVADLFEKQKDRCAHCGKKHAVMEIDHIEPLSRGGRNDKSNLQLLCRPCNRSKGAKDPIEWAQSKGRLL